MGVCNANSTIAVAILCVAGCRPSGPSTYRPSPQEKRMDAAHQAEEQGEYKIAADEFFKLCNASPPYIRACFAQVQLMYKTRSIQEAREAAVALILRFPNEALAQKTVKKLSRSYAKNGDMALGIETLYSLSEKLKGSDIWDTLLFQSAVLARAASYSKREERLLERIVQECGRFESQLWDDAVWRLSKIAEERKDLNHEKKWLMRLIDSHESSRLIGSYTTPYYDDSLMRLGAIYLKEGNTQEALKTFEVLSKRKTSPKQNQGRVGVARTLLLMKKKKAACQMLQVVIENGDRDRVVAEANKLISSAQCTIR